MTNAYDPFLAVGAVLFVLGAIGFATRRNLIVLMLSGELMLHGVSLTLLAFGQMHGRMEGQAFTIFVLTIAACEAGLGLALVLSLYQRTRSLDIHLWTALREADLPSLAEGAHRELPAETPQTLEFPSLLPAGLRPTIDSDAPLAPQTRPPEVDLPTRRFRYGDPAGASPTDPNHTAGSGGKPAPSSSAR